MSMLVTILQNMPLADSRQIASTLGIDHRSFFRTITEYLQEIEEDFGKVRFEIASSGRTNQPLRYALLTEEQTYSYMSYSRNTEPARACKRLLVKAFTEAKTLLQVAKHRDQTYTLGDALRQRALSNEDSVPDGFFTTQIEFGKELYYWERIINASLDSSAQIEISIGKCWQSFAKKFFSQALLERQRYRHRLSNGQIVEVWCYPIKYLPAFRRWLKEVYFVEKFPAYQQYRAKRVGADAILMLIGTRTTQRRISSKSIEQLPLFPVA